MRFAGLVVNNLLRRRLRGALTIVGLAVDVAAVVVLLGVAWGFADSSARSYEQRGVDLVVVRAGVAERITSSLRADLADRIRALPSVASVEGSLTEMASFDDGAMLGIPLHGLDPAGTSIAVYELEAGRPLQAGARKAALLGAGLAEALRKKPGDEVEIEGVLFRVAGVYRAADPLQGHTAVAPLADLQAMMDRPGQVSEFQVRLAPSHRTAEGVRQACRDVEALRNAEGEPVGCQASPVRDFVAGDTETGLLAAVAWGTSAIALCLSILGILNTMLMSVFERTQELGVLRALGWPRRSVMRMILGESLVLSACGAAAGVGAAFLLVQALAAWSFTCTLVSPSLAPAAVAAGVGAGLAAGALGAMYPAYRASCIPPTEALRHE